MDSGCGWRPVRSHWFLASSIPKSYNTLQQPSSLPRPLCGVSSKHNCSLDNYVHWITYWIIIVLFRDLSEIVFQALWKLCWLSPNRWYLSLSLLLPFLLHISSNPGYGINTITHPGSFLKFDCTFPWLWHCSDLSGTYWAHSVAEQCHTWAASELGEHHLLQASCYCSLHWFVQNPFLLSNDIFSETLFLNLRFPQINPCKEWSDQEHPGPSP